MADIKFANIAKWGMTIGGTVLSLIPGLAAVGVPLIVAGQAIPTQAKAGTTDPVSNYAAQLPGIIGTVSAMQAAGKQPTATIIFNQILAFIQQNLILIFGGLAVIFILPKLFKRRRR